MRLIAIAKAMIVIVDPLLSHFPVSGIFGLIRPDAILQTLAEVLPIRQRSLTPFWCCWITVEHKRVA